MTRRSGSPPPKRRRRGSLDRKRARTKVVVLVMAGLMVLSLVGAALGAMIGGQQVEPEPVAEPEPATIEPAADPCPPADDAPEVDSRVYDEPPLAELTPGATYLVTFETSCGAFTVEVDHDRAPVAAANLVGLVEDGYYDGVVFHRVVAGFVVQTGDPAGTGCGQEDCSPEGFDPDAPTYPGYSFEDELDTAEERFAEVRDELAQLLDAEVVDDVDLDLVPGGYPRGTVAMANRGPDTNGSQFFVAQGDPTLLPAPAFTVLGHVVDGMDVVDRIAGQPVDALDRPLEPVVILAVQIEQH